MSRQRWTVRALIACALLAATLIYAQTRQTTIPPTVPAAAATATLARQVEARRAVLTTQELQRIAIAGDLEFSPRAAPRPLPFLRFCLIPPATAAAAIDPHRSLFVHDRATLDAGPDFSLRRTLNQIASQVSGSVPGTSAVTIFASSGTRRTPRPGWSRRARTAPTTAPPSTAIRSSARAPREARRPARTPRSMRV